MVSIMSMPATEVAASLPASRICTRVTLILLSEMIFDRKALIMSVVMPIRVSIRFCLTISTR